MKCTVLLLALFCAYTLAADNAVVAPRSNANLQSTTCNLKSPEAITIPQMLSYQGKLTDSLGVPVADTLYAIRFRLYAQPTGGTQFWEEDQPVRTQEGLFSVLLGAVTPIGSMPDGGAAYLGMAVEGGAELTPRLRIASAAYAYLSARAANAELLQGKDTTALDGRYVNEAQANSVSSAMITNGTIAAVDLNQMGASSGQVMKWAGSAWAPRNDSVGAGGDGTVRKVVESTGIVCSPNPITDSGTVRFDSAWGDARFVNESQAAGGGLTGTYPSPTIANNAVGSAQITDGSVTSADIRDTTITTAKLKDDAVTSAKILDGTVTSADIRDTTVSTADVKDDAITSAKILDGAVTSADIRDTTVNTADVKDAAVTAPKLNQMGASSGQVMKWTGSAWAPGNDSVGSGGGGGTVRKVVQATGVVCSPNPLTDSGTVAFDSTWGDARFVNEAQTAGGALTGTYPKPTIAADAVTSGNIVDGSLTAADIRDTTITAGKLKDDAVTSAKVLDGAITSADIRDTTVNTAEMKDAAVTAPKLNQMGATANQVLKWTGSVWAPRNDSVGGGTPDSVPGSFAVTTDLRVYGKGRIGPGNSNAGTAAFVAGSGNTASANYSSVAGGTDNAAGGVSSHVGGGSENKASGSYSFVGGGEMNYATGVKSAIGGGVDNTATGLYSTVGGGDANTAGDAATDTCATVAGGYVNAAAGMFSTVGGGKYDSATGHVATVGGGWSNKARGDLSVVGGGLGNVAGNSTATVGGGNNNRASGIEATVGGGNSNEASGDDAMVGGGVMNSADGDYSAVGGGDYNTAAGTRSAVAGGGSNNALGVRAFVGGGYANSAGDSTLDTAAVVAGGYANLATARYSTVGGGKNDTASGSYATVGGGEGNAASDAHSTVAGGYYNKATGYRSFVGGGLENEAGGYEAVLAGGSMNHANGQWATVAGGVENSVGGARSTVGGGQDNSVSGYCSTVPGGDHNSASGDFSLAAGTHAKARATGTFVWSDSCGATDSVRNATAHRWMARARGGVYFYTNLGMTTGSYLSAGGSSWNSVSDSMTKENFRPVDKKALLDAVARMRVRDYNLKSQDASIRHIGPVAQDFHNAFGFGESSTAINMEDADGVALAAIQALYDEMKAVRELNAAQQVEIEQLKAELKRR